MAGWEYTETPPRSCLRVRLACAWPLLLGMRTLAQLQAGNVLDATHRIKVTRYDVWQLVAWSVLLHPWPKAWRRLFEQEASQVSSS